MKRIHPTKAVILAELRRIDLRDGQVSHSVIKKETGWDRYWFDKHWPVGGYAAACLEAGVKRGAIVGVETNIRITDMELAIEFADTVVAYGKIPPLKRLKAIARIGDKVILRGGTYEDAKRRIIDAYFQMPVEKRSDATVARQLQGELERLNGRHASSTPKPATSALQRHSIHVPPEYIALVQDFRDRGEEEKRQLVSQLFCEILGYRRHYVRSEHKHNDIRVHDRRDRPWLVVEVKARLDTERDKRAARRQGFDYAHRLGMRYVVISDGDLYEVFDRCEGERLRYDEMLQGSFRLSSLRSRDSDLLSLLAAER